MAQAKQQQAQAKENARLQAERAKQQYKQSLVQLAMNENRAANSKLYKAAYKQAKSDFKTLRAKRIAPNQLGALQQLFRLTSNDINRDDRTTHWPDVLRSEDFYEPVQSLDQMISEGGIDSSESAQKFLEDLNSLNIALNIAAVEGKVDANDFAIARRFITGLANEVHSSDINL